MCNTLGNVFRLIIVGGVCLALAMQFVVTFQCNFLTTSEGNNVGIWFVDSGDGECVERDGDSGESLVSGAQSALTISTIAGFTAGILVLFEWLICKVCCAGCVEGLAFAAAWMVGGAVFMIYGISDCADVEGQVTGGEDGFDAGDVVDAFGQDTEESSCEWGSDASYMVVSCVLYFACGFLLCCTPQPDPVCKQ